MAYTSWSLVRQALSMAMPLQIMASRHCRAVHRVDEYRPKFDHHGGPGATIGKHHAVAGAGTIGDLLRVAPVCTCTPRRSIWACSTRPPPSSTCTAVSGGANPPHGFPDPCRARFWRIPAQAGCRQSIPRPSGLWLHGFQVFDGAVHSSGGGRAPAF